MEPMEDASTLEQALLRRAAQTRTPANGSIELLPLCNMNCDMCYVRLSRAQMERQGRMRTAAEWLDVGAQMQRAGVLFLLLTGGEPLLHPEFREIYLGIKNLGMFVTINTNGTLIDEEWAAFFGANPPRRINITLYGADERAYTSLCHYPGGFEKTVNAVRLLRQNGVDVKLASSVTRENVQDIDRMHAIAEELDVPMRMDTYMMPAVRERGLPFAMQARLLPEDAACARIRALEREMGPEMFAQYRARAIWETDNILPETGPGRMHCMAGSCSFTVNWQGEMRPCVVMTSPAASVFELGFEEAWRYIVEETDKIRLSETCSACPMRPLCRTCAACALLETGSYGGTADYMCRYARESLRLLREEPEEKK